MSRCRSSIRIRVAAILARGQSPRPVDAWSSRRPTCWRRRWGTARRTTKTPLGRRYMQGAAGMEPPFVGDLRSVAAGVDRNLSGIRCLRDDWSG